MDDDETTAALAAALTTFMVEMTEGLIRSGALSERGAAEIAMRTASSLRKAADAEGTKPIQRGSLQGLAEVIQTWGISLLDRGISQEPAS